MTLSTVNLLLELSALYLIAGKWLISSLRDRKVLNEFNINILKVYTRKQYLFSFFFLITWKTIFLKWKKPSQLSLTQDSEPQSNKLLKLANMVYLQTSGHHCLCFPSPIKWGSFWEGSGQELLIMLQVCHIQLLLCFLDSFKFLFFYSLIIVPRQFCKECLTTLVLVDLFIYLCSFKQLHTLLFESLVEYWTIYELD